MPSWTVTQTGDLRRYASAAAGAYQFMPFTWNMVKRSIGVRGFGPEAQDQGALFLIQRRKALLMTDTGQLTPVLAAKLAPEWASFPTLAGRSFYGQPVKKYTRLVLFTTSTCRNCAACVICAVRNWPKLKSQRFVLAHGLNALRVSKTPLIVSFLLKSSPNRCLSNEISHHCTGKKSNSVSN